MISYIITGSKLAQEHFEIFATKRSEWPEWVAWVSLITRFFLGFNLNLTPAEKATFKKNTIESFKKKQIPVLHFWFCIRLK